MKLADDEATRNCFSEKSTFLAKFLYSFVNKGAFLEKIWKVVSNTAGYLYLSTSVNMLPTATIQDWFIPSSDDKR